ncbi:BadF/BadG/BcrA/BcrD ATPase family protein [Sporomusa acidovorans]|nr:BadF/BadG/BcrA/BcrD ATPase family protein [Sporomusa acidovorans]
MQWVIGIDGGGTKTVGWAADLTGRILGQAEKGSGNYHTTGLPNFKAVIAGIVDELAGSCRLRKDDLQVISLGLAGADRLKDKQIITQALSELGLSCRYLVNSDAKIAMVAGLGKAEGIVLIAGTGSIAYGLNRQGEVFRAGGWGQLASDEGSGYAIGRQALVRGIRAAEGRDKTTGLLPMIMEYWGLASWNEMIGYINAPAITKAAIAALAPLVAVAAERQDEVAQEILWQAGDELACLVESVIKRGFHQQGSIPVCIYGGIISNIPLVRRQVEAALAGKAVIVVPQTKPVAGAVRFALNSISGSC